MISGNTLNPAQLVNATAVDSTYTSSSSCSSTGVMKKSSIQLSTKSKKTLVDDIKKIDHSVLKDALVKAALEMLVFPMPIITKLSNLQSVYFENKENNAVKTILVQAIVTYFNTESFQQFLDCLANEFSEDNWNSTLLNFLSRILKISISEDPIVEATINEGKIYWRVVQGEKITYERQKGKDVLFSADKTWRMDWKLFRRFKDAGKRTGTVEITQDIFVSEAEKQNLSNVQGIWQELKDRGILTPRNRLSNDWRMLSNEPVELNNKKYQKIISIIYSIVNNETNKEMLAVIPNAYIYRPERSKKQWAGTGRVNNIEPTSLLHCTRLWDVSINDDLKKHRNTSAEKSQENSKLNYDHIPSSDFLKNYGAGLKVFYSTEIEVLNRELEQITKSIEAQKNEALEKSRITHHTRLQFQQSTHSSTKYLEEKKASLETSLNAYNNWSKQIIFEMARPELWWSIAIPEKMHMQGTTYKQSSSSQQDSRVTPFIDEINVYLQLMKPVMHSSSDEYIIMLGAFRYLYRSLLKPPTKITENSSVGFTQYSFFNQSNIKKQIDTLFQERIIEAVNIREGKIGQIK